MCFEKKSFQKRFLVCSLILLVVSFSFKTLSQNINCGIMTSTISNENIKTNQITLNMISGNSKNKFVIKDNVFFSYKSYLGRLVLFNISNYRKPIFIKEIVFNRGEIISLERVNDNLFVCFRNFNSPNNNMTIAIISIKNTTNPIITSEYVYERDYHRFRSSALLNSTHGFYWLISHDDDIWLLNCSSYNTIEKCRTFNQTELNLTTPAFDQIIVQNNLMYTFEHGYVNHSFGIFNVTNPFKPQLISEGKFVGGSADRYLLHNDYVYCIDRYPGSYKVIDISNKSNPIYLRGYNTNSYYNPDGVSLYLEDMDFYGNLIYIMTEDKILTYDNTHPGDAEQINVFSPEILPSYTENEHVYKEELVAGNIINDKFFILRYTYLSGTRSYSIIDLGDSLNLKEIVIFGQDLDWIGVGTSSTIEYHILQFSSILVVLIFLLKRKKQVKLNSLSK